MALEPRKRFASAEKFLAALEPFRSKSGELSEEEPRTLIPIRGGRVRAVWLAAVMVVLLASVALVAAFVGRGGDESAEPSSLGDRSYVDAGAVEPDAMVKGLGTADGSGLSDQSLAAGARGVDGAVSLRGDASASESEAVEEEVRLEVRVQPKVARIRIEGEEVEGNPHVTSFPRDGSKVRVEAWAHGYVRQSKQVVLEEDRVVEFRLRPASSRGKTGTTSGPATPPTTKTENRIKVLPYPGGAKR
jgi:hypothetical protein